MADPTPIKFYEEFDEVADGKTAAESAERRFAVLYNVDTTAIIARRYSGLPAISSSHPDDTDLVVKRRSAKRFGKSSLNFLVRVFYKTVKFAEIGSEAVAPLDRPTQRSAHISSGTIEIDSFADDKPIVNFAGQNLRATIDHGDRLITYVWNVGKFNPQKFDAFAFRLNAQRFSGYAAKQVLCLGISQEYTEENFEDAIEVYWRNNATFLVRLNRATAAGNGGPQGFQTRILNAGTMQLDKDKKLVPILDPKSNQQFSEQIPLDDKGKAILEEGGGEDDPKATWIQEDVYPLANFNNIGF